MTRRSIYLTTLALFLASSALTLTSIILPRWISWDAHPKLTPPVHVQYGLHRRCSSLDGGCRHFPTNAECMGDERYFCSMWRSVGFLMSFAVVIEGMCLIAFLVLIVGGKQKREGGWGVMSGLLVLGAAVEAVGMGLVAYLHDNDPRFFTGFNLDASFIMCTVSWVVLLLSATGIVASRYLLEPEGGYELIPNEQ